MCNITTLVHLTLCLLLLASYMLHENIAPTFNKMLRPIDKIQHLTLHVLFDHSNFTSQQMFSLTNKHLRTCRADSNLMLHS